MRGALVVTLSCLLASPAAVAQVPPSSSLPPGAERREASLMTRIGPQSRLWITQQAIRELTMGDIDQARAIGAARGHFESLGTLNQADVEAVAYLVLMEALRAQQEDLKTMTGQVKQLNDAKAAARVPAVRRDAPPAGASTPVARGSVAVRPDRSLVVDRAAITPRPRPKQEFDTDLERVKNDLDALRDMGEMESLRLQMAMDRRAKMISILSNLLKKMSDSRYSLTTNLK